jgi:hypothetical protein
MMPEKSERERKKGTGSLFSLSEPLLFLTLFLSINNREINREMILCFGS